MKILFYTFFYPPDEEPRAIQIERLAKSMKSSVDIVCRSTSKNSYLKNKINKNQYRFKYSEVKNKYLSYILNIFCIPDRYIFWSIRSIFKVKENLKIKNYDLIITFGQPMSIHLSGLIISKIYKKKWIAHFSDPWYGNIYSKNNIFKNVSNLFLESLVINNCDKCIFTNKRALNFTLKKYTNIDLKKAFVLPHCYQNKIEQKEEKKEKNNFIIRHLGNLYGPRSPIEFIKALVYIYKNDPSYLNNISVEFIGDISLRFNINYFESILPERILSFRKRVGYQESLNLMKSSSLLLLIDAKSEENIFLPSKLIDYIGSNTPIFAISSAGASVDVIKDIGHFYDSSYEPRIIAEKLKRIINILKDKKNIIKYNQKSIENYSNKKVAEYFERIISY